MVKVAVFCVLMVTIWGLASACGRSRGRYRRQPRDITPPTITCPPDRTEYADPLQVNTRVHWDETVVVATDNRDGKLRWWRNGKRPGQMFSEGVTRIRYSTRDRSGNYRSCTFTITIIVKTCPKWGDIQDGRKECHVSHDASYVRRGSLCRFSCYGGHELVGPDKATCLDSNQWNIPSLPYCQKLQCPVLFPSQDQYDKVNIDCTDLNYFKSICSYNCVPGYSVLPGYSKIRRCNEFGSWVGSIPQCVDAEPPTYITCPYGITGYAEHTKTSGRVWWNKPQAEDNSGYVVTIQKSGPSPGTDLEVGEYDVVYMSYDAVNNTAICDFMVVVKQIKCHTIYLLPYTSVQCPTGRIYGSRCEFSCEENTALNGYHHAECQKQGTTVPYGVWTFENNQPYCELQRSCPALRPPDNGALACDTWMYGRFCQMLCQEKHVVMDDPATDIDEVEIHSRLLVCGDSGRWYTSGDIPNCQKVSDRKWMAIKISLSYVYYTGACDETIDDIKLKFMQAITNAIGKSCDPSSCNINAVKVICGFRTKRDTGSSREKRETSEEGLSLEYLVELPIDIDIDDVLQVNTNVTNSLNTAIDNGDLDMEVNGTLIGPIVEDSELQGECSEGSVFDQQSLLCVECTVGYYYNAEYESCSRCPVGYYQDEDRQTSCKICPTGTTTEGKGASSLQHCKDACTAGHYSNTGTEPCTVCDLGTYSIGYGSTHCKSCPGSQITLTAAATSISECRDFDITYTVPNITDTAVPALITIENVTSVDHIIIAFWVKCSQCGQVFQMVDSDDTVIVNIENGDLLRINWNGIVHETNINITGSDTWKKFTVSTSDDVVTVYIDSMEVVKENYTQQQPLSSSVNVTVGGEGFVGFISQLNIWSSPLTGPPSAVESCFTDVPGDIVAWKQFYDQDGTFIFTKSKCDAVDNCLDNPCHNMGSCTDGKDSFLCACAEGFTGNLCDVNIDDCVQSVCDNNGVCVDGIAHYTCQCPYGFTGKFCEIKYVDGGWTEWDTSGDCSVTCGLGVQNRSRVCENPEPSNGGKLCEGEDAELVECETNTVCVQDCLMDPSDIEHGNINCSWTDESNDTRICRPFCDDGYEFDSDMFVDTSGIICGPDTGYSWNINTTDNPLLQLPSCTAKANAVTNILNYTMEYATLNEITDDLTDVIETNADDMLTQTGCVSTGECSHQTMVHMSSNSSVLLTVQLTCTVGNDIDSCYNLLADLVERLNDLISQEQFTIPYDGTDHHVGVNTTSLDGISTCLPGHIPVFNFCVPCGKGTYAYTTYCEVCPVGTYQDMEAQTSCKSCPIDWTTAGYMTRDKNSCNVHVDPISTEEKITTGVIIGLTVGLTLGVIAIVVVGLRLMSKRPYKGDRKENFTDAVVISNKKTLFQLSKSDTQDSIDTLVLDAAVADANDKIRPDTPAPRHGNYFETDLER